MKRKEYIYKSKPMKKQPNSDSGDKVSERGSKRVFIGKTQSKQATEQISDIHVSTYTTD